ncbi:3'-5' exonuclease [Prevotella sp. HUN102]|uniref:3'-5' exonuclease n=1 Tax=Prevotella sp. HUN102 TaxID=1392486 RepID=UPI00048A8572|nr:3'-5' exonuclease [Prevotella sp. HUN102]
MTTILYNKFDKKSIGQLPRATFPGKIVVVLNEEEANKAVDYLLSCDILGIDTETKPVFKKGQHNKVALLQVSTRDICFLFRLNLIGIPLCLVRFLEDRTVPKIGLSLTDDIMMLHQRSPFKQGYFIDLQNLVGEFGIEDMSLQKIYANLFHERITKREQLSNWEAPILNDKQKMYAATDAWTCIQIFEKLNELRDSGNYKTEVVPVPDTDNEEAK